MSTAGVARWTLLGTAAAVVLSLGAIVPAVVQPRSEPASCGPRAVQALRYIADHGGSDVDYYEASRILGAGCGASFGRAADGTEYAR